MSTRHGTARARQVRRISRLEPARASGRRPATGTDAAFPVFGERQRRMFDASPLPMRIFEHGSLKYLAVNDAALKLYGYTRKEFLKLRLPDTRHPEEHDAQRATLTEQSGYIMHFGPRRHVTKSGAIIVVEIISQDIDFEGRNARVGLIIDVTERARVQEALWQRDQALRESNEFLHKVIESSSDCIKVLDLDGRLLMMSAGGQRLMEIDDLAPLLNTCWLEFWRGQDHEAAWAAIMKARNGSVGTFQGYCPTVKGAPRWWDVVVTPILDAEGKPAKLLAISRDITERRRAEQELQANEEFLRRVIESSRDCIKVLDLDGRLLWINETGRRLLEIDDVLALNNRSYLDFWNGLDRENAQSALASARDGNASSFEGYGPTMKGGPKWWDEIVTPILDRDGRPEKLLVVSRDITEHKRAAEARVAQAARQRDTLVREVHHRIKNSLQGVVGLLRQKIRNYPSIAPGIEEAIAQLQSVATVYGLQGRELERQVSLAEILDAICTSAENLTGGSVVRDFDVDNGHGTLVDEAEAVPLAVALNELVFNALKHQPAGDGERRARVALHETNDSAEIRITNRGRLPAGFDFAGGRAVGHGLGLVRTLIALPGGAITFTGSGEEVEVALKLSPPLLAEWSRPYAP